MAKHGDMIEHPVTGERIAWRKVAADTGGRLLEADLFVAPGGFLAAEHIHPNQEESFEVQAGTLRLRVGGEETILRTGERGSVPPRTPHGWWNAGDDELHVTLSVTPALRTEVFFETFFGLGRDGKVNRKGLPNPLQMAVLADEYRDEMRLAKMPMVLQRLISGPVANLGRARGYRGWYPEYSTDA